jgi:lipopolysaccharide transport system permease protein
MISGMQKNDQQDWDYQIDSGKNSGFGLGQLSHFKDLLYLLVKRDITTIYKQTVLGPLWLVLQPLITALTFTIIFGRIAGMAPGGIPMFLFYFSGIVIWNFFSECLLKISDTFTVNTDLFSKVFFPRLIMPISIVITSSIKMIVNLLIFLFVLTYWVLFKNFAPDLHPLAFLLIPLVFLIAAMFAMGLGLMITAATSKYKDLRFFLQFGVQMLMYLSPVLFPLSMLSDKMKLVFSFNPMSAPVEGMRYVFLGQGSVDPVFFSYSFTCALVFLLLGLVVFNRKAKSFIDTV